MSSSPPHFPPEIWHEILSYLVPTIFSIGDPHSRLDHDFRGPDVMVDICLLSRSMLQLCRPLLYRHVFLHGSKGKTRQFLRTLCCNPDLGLLVLRLDGEHGLFYDVDAERGGVGNMMRLAKAKLDPMSAAYAAVCEIEQVTEASDSARSTLFGPWMYMALMPNLELLELVIQPNTPELIIPRFILSQIMAARGADPPFRNGQTVPPYKSHKEVPSLLARLRELNLKHGTTKPKLINMDLFEIALHLPSLERFSADGVMWPLHEAEDRGEYGYWLDYYEPQEFDMYHADMYRSIRTTSNLQRVTLLNCDIYGQGLDRLFTSCPKLQHLEITWSGNLYSDDMHAP